MKKYFSIIACGALLLSGCTREAFTAPEFESTLVFKVSTQEEGKTSLGELSEGKRKILWSAGDKININGFESEALSEEYAGHIAAQFVFSPAPDAPYNVIYPASIYNSEGKVILPDAPSVMPMYGHSTNPEKTNLKLLTGAAKITVAPGDDSDKISYVQIISDGAQLRGEFSVDCTTGQLTGTAASDVNSSVKRYVRKSVTTDSLEVFIPVPAGTYNTLTVRVVDENGHYLEVKTTAPKTFVAGQINAFPKVAFNPTGTLVDLEISSAAKWNEFATAYNEGTITEGFFAITADLDFTGLDVVTVGSYKSEKYFYGHIDGGGHSIKNLKSTKALVAAFGANSTIKDLTIDETCSYTVPYGAEEPESGFFGPFAYYLKGTMKNCVNKASITLDLYRDTPNTSDIYVGGLIGRIREGVAENCVNYGTVTFNETYNSSENAHAGGIAGYISNAEGVIRDCTNHGEILNHACWAKEVFQGGIVGYSVGTVTGCSNDGGITVDVEPRPTGDACKHLHLAGISAYQGAGAVTLCTNAGDIYTTSKIKLQYIGGIIGSIAGTIRAENNTSSGNIHSVSLVRCPMIGGLYGKISADNEFTFSGSPFTGRIDVDNFEGGDNCFAYIGGLIGIARNNMKIIGVGAPVEIHDSITITATDKKPWRLSVGGVIGSVGESWSAHKDTLDLGDGKDPYEEIYPSLYDGRAEISNIHTTGTIVYKGGSGIKPGARFGSFGGIIGGMLCGGTVENCTNDASVQYCTANTGSNSNGYPVHVGGIVGRADGGTSTVRGCTNNGKIYNQLYNNNNFDIRGHRGCNAIGGIVGSFGYRLFSNDVMTIENCTSTGLMYAYRGPAGGIIGYANHTTVKNCNFLDNTIKRGSPVGGVVAAGENSAVEGCTAKTNLSATTGGSTRGDCGGIIGDARGCSVDGSRFFGTITGDKLYGGILGQNDDKCTIGTKSKCLYGGNVGGVDINEAFYIMYYAGNPELIEVDTLEHLGYWDGTL